MDASVHCRAGGPLMTTIRIWKYIACGCMSIFATTPLLLLWRVTDCLWGMMAMPTGMWHSNNQVACRFEEHHQPLASVQHTWASESW